MPDDTRRTLQPGSTRVLDELKDPDPIGRDLELLRTRSYRVTDDLRRYAIAEALENLFLDGSVPDAQTMAYVRRELEQVRRGGTVSGIDFDVLKAARIDVDIELARRERFGYRHYLNEAEPSRIVAVVGAPRSGTSHLVNLLASSGRFAFFTTATCWAWPVWNLRHPRRTVFTEHDRQTVRGILAVDNKRTRIVPGLTMPGEAEDIFARAMPVYRHLGGHRYAITQPRAGDYEILQANCAAHLQHFQRREFLTKSPFNSLRIPLLEHIWPGRVDYIHIVRDRTAVAESMRQNNFDFEFGDRDQSAERSRDRFVAAVNESAPPGRLHTVSHDDLVNQPHDALAEIYAWLDR